VRNGPERVIGIDVGLIDYLATIENRVSMDCGERKPPSENSASLGASPSVYAGRSVLPG